LLEYAYRAYDNIAGTLAVIMATFALPPPDNQQTMKEILPKLAFRLEPDILTNVIYYAFRDTQVDPLLLQGSTSRETQNTADVEH
jgi:hypothetical protein